MIDPGNDLLQNPSLSVTEVALRWGFVNISRFSRYFQDAYGVRPAMAGRDLSHQK
ncbi:helix-turn-helix domain-containing protein [Pseudomonas sp.]|uniref:helix-turn-helix domain-containing protein n=1 Tax=Pseudomonas sp. TaxID=306 RepID=UPI003D6E98B5